jgi:hypothetical protein
MHTSFIHITAKLQEFRLQIHKIVKSVKYN